MSRTWRLGTRGSQLALAQSGQVARAITEVSGDEVELVVIRTRGDAITDRPLAAVGGKGLFTKELEDAMLAGDIDLAVHSMKDMPSDQPEGLMLAAVPERQDPRDVLVGATLAGLKKGAVVGTGSARRRLQLLALRPDLEVRGIRGNVDTRILKQRSGEYDAIVLAAAGLNRLDRAADITEHVPAESMVPAIGQGALALQCREDDAELRAVLSKLEHEDSAVAIRAERAFMVALQGGCSVPAACHAVVEGERVHLRAFFGREDGVWVAETGECGRDDVAEAGVEMATRLRVRLDAQPSRSKLQEE